LSVVHRKGDIATLFNLTEQGAPVTLTQLEACQTPIQLSDYFNHHPKAMEDSAISARCMPPQHMAALAGHLPSVDWPLSHGIDPESPDRRGNAALPITSESQLVEKHCAISSRLLAANAKTNVPGGRHEGAVLNRAIIGGGGAGICAPCCRMRVGTPLMRGLAGKNIAASSSQPQR